MATIIKSNDSTENIEPANGKVFTLEELQKAIGGYIKIISINSGEYNGKFMIVDEEGLLNPNPQLNIEASKIVGYRIVGNVVIIDKDQIV